MGSCERTTKGEDQHFVVYYLKTHPFLSTGALVVRMLMNLCGANSGGGGGGEVVIFIYCIYMSHGQNTRRPLYQGGVRFCITHAKTVENDKVSPKNDNP